jgi:uncharacterized protein YgiM (DUF1202 family)
MKRTRSSSLWLGLSLAIGLAGQLGRAAEQTAVVKENRVNVRGQASLVGEVITQLKKGEQVIILSETNLPNAKADEPAKWYQIRMPENTPVWVFAQYVDPTAKTVKTARLNLRAGPGENYSVVGRLQRGDVVKDIRTVEDWMEIETPPTAYGFISSDLVDVTGAAPATPAAAPAATKLEQPAAQKTQTNPPPTKVQQVQSEPPPLPGKDSQPRAAMTVPPPLVMTNTAAQKLPQRPPPTGTNIPAPAFSVRTNAVTAPPMPMTNRTSVLKEEAPPKRVVRREGLVRSTRSVQAPTYFELLSPDTHKTIEFLHAETIDLQLKDYRGKHVIVTGEEGIDPRWPNIPVLEIETLELAP